MSRQDEDGVVRMSSPPQQRERNSILSAVKGDLLPSIAVFLVALPLCMGIAIASGAPVAAGLITGIIGGLVVATIAGAPLQVSGPAAGLTVVVYGIIQEFGIEALGIVVLIGGILQILAGVFRLGQWFRAVSPAVIHGMLAGIGILILGSQFQVMVDGAPKKSGLDNLLAIPHAIAMGLPLPESSTPEDRAARREVLQEVSSLGQRQRSILDEAKAAGRADTQSGEELRTRLIAEQEVIIERLRQIQTQIAETGDAASGTGEGDQRVNAALTEAEGALAQLRGASPQQWSESQQASADGLQTLSASLRNHQWAGKIGLLTLGVLVLWQKFRPRRLKSIPAPLVAVSIATLVAAYWHLPIMTVDVPDSLLSAVRLPDMNLFRALPLAGLLQAGLVIAIIASAETLLCATAVDQMHSGERTNYDRELMAQGIGNSLCGVLGALPMTGVIVRSAANVQAGARTRASAFLHGLWLLLFVALLGPFLRYIPISCLAAVLVYTGYKLVNIDGIRKLKKYGWGEVFIYAATVTGVVVEDLLIGVLIGITLSAIKLLLTFSHLRISLDTDFRSQRAVLSLEGAATFLRLPLLAAKLEEVPPNAELHIDFERLRYIDHACLDLLMNWAKQHEATGGRLVIDWDSLHAHFRPDYGMPQKSVA